MSERIKPPCHNRPPRTGGLTRYGIDQSNGETISVHLSNNWFIDRCATWDGVGIGQPTEKYPLGTPYPMAHGWDCSGCRWMPDKHLEDL